MSHGGSLFKQCQILDSVNKRMKSLVSDHLLNNTMIRIHLEEVYYSFLGAKFQRQYRNVSVAYDYNTNFVKRLEDKLREINSLRITNIQSMITCIRFTEGKWSELVSLEIIGEKNGIVLENIPDSVIHLRITTSSCNWRLRYEAPDINLPPNLETFSVSRIKLDNPNFFPQSLQKLSVLKACKTTFHEDIKLTNLQKLYWKNCNVHVLQSNFPVLTHLSLSGDFNQKIDNLPKTLVYLCLEGAFNQSVDNLPASISHLTFFGAFDQPINRLPQSLTYLRIDGDFCQRIDSLPSALKYLWLSCKIQHEITKLPALISLTTSTRSKRIIFPSTLETLVHSDQFHEDNFSLLKDSGCLRRLTIQNNAEFPEIHIPDGVVHLQLVLRGSPQVYYFPSSLKFFYTRQSKRNTTIIPQDWKTTVKILDFWQHFDLFQDYFYIEFA